jgi:C4-dicarboxylate-specific signal transduction histidine kinase
MQVFLNLVNNSARAVSKKDQRLIFITAKSDGNRVQVEFSDNGGGVVHPEHLFRPFQAGAEATGLGLFLSRAFMHSFGGELRYQPLAGGARFIVDLNSAIAREKEL